MSVINSAFLLPIVATPMSDMPIECMLEQGYPAHSQCTVACGVEL
jgi:hypothetical protein